jgi:glycosyltransferase involved in cell wall biosynthesis
VRVSVILPNYNYARYLKECMRSILAQTMSDLELFYVDDGSTDASNRVADSFRSDGRLRMYLFGENSGTVYGRWNQAAANATGDWLWFPNADDAAHPRFLEEVLRLADAHPACGLVHAGLGRMDSEGRVLSVKQAGDQQTARTLHEDYWCAGFEEIPLLSSGLYLPTTSNLIISRYAFESVGGFDSRLWHAADYDLYMRILHRYDIAYSAHLLVFKREHGANTTTTTKASIQDLIFCYTFSMTYCRMKEDPRYSSEACDIVLRCAKAHMFDLITNPAPVIPANLRFTIDAIYAVLPEPRLLRLTAA